MNAMTVDIDFPNANHHGVDFLPDRVVFRMDQCLDGWSGARFIHVRFNHAPDRPIHVQILDPEYTLNWINDTIHPCTSADDLQWIWHRPRWDPANRLWDVTIIPPQGQSSFFFAVREPYPPKRLDWLSARFQGDARFHRGVIGQTVEGHAIPFLTLSDDTAAGVHKARVFIISCLHAMEISGPWMLEGMLLTLLSDHPRMRKALARMVVEVVPIVNWDGLNQVRYGSLNVHHKNLNREWANEQPEPEVQCIRDHILAAHARGERYDLFFDAHSAGRDDHLKDKHGGSMAWSIPVSVLDYLWEYLPGDWTALPLSARHRCRRAVTADRFMLENLRIPSVIYHGGQYPFPLHGLLECPRSAESFLHEGKMAMKAILDFLRLGCGPDVAITCPIAGTIVHGRAEIPVRAITSDDIPFPPPGFNNAEQRHAYTWTGGYEKVQARLDGGTWIDLANSGEFREGEWTGKLTTPGTPQGRVTLEARALAPNAPVVTDSVSICIGDLPA